MHTVDVHAVLYATVSAQADMIKRKVNVVINFGLQADFHKTSNCAKSHEIGQIIKFIVGHTVICGSTDCKNFLFKR